jgi:centromere/kinetochore protein ZW10
VVLATKPPPPALALAPSPPPPAPAKRATRLERLANKSRSAVSSPAPSAPPTPAPAPEPAPKLKVQRPVPAPVRTRETYLAPTRARDILALARAAREEGAALAQAGLVDGADAAGGLVAQAGAGALDVFRALGAPDQGEDAARAMRFANALLFLAGEGEEPGAREVADEWFEGCVDAQALGLDDILADADGFIDAANREAYDRCEDALARVVRRIRSVAHEWKVCPVPCPCTRGSH